MTDKQIIYNCPHISLTDWGTYACKLYNPRDKNCLVVSGNCDSNVGCPYKQLKRAEQKLEKIEEIVKYYAEIKCEDCKYLSVSCVDCNEVIAQEVIQIIEGKENE